MIKEIVKFDQELSLVAASKKDDKFLVTNELLGSILPVAVDSVEEITEIKASLSEIERDRKIGQFLLWVSRLSSIVVTGLVGSEDLTALAWPTIGAIGMAATTTYLAFDNFSKNQRKIGEILNLISGGLESRQDLLTDPKTRSMVEILVRDISDLSNAERGVGCSSAELNINLLLNSGVLLAVAPEIQASVIATTILGLGQINWFHKVFSNQEESYKDIKSRIRSLANFGRTDNELQEKLVDERKKSLKSVNLVVGIGKLATSLPLLQALSQVFTTGSSSALLPALVEPVRAALSSRQSISKLMDGVVGMNLLKMKGQLARKNLYQLAKNIVKKPLSFLMTEMEWDEFREHADDSKVDLPKWTNLKRMLIFDKFNPLRLDGNGKLFSQPVNLNLNLDEGITFLRSPSGVGKTTLMDALAGKLRFDGELGLLSVGEMTSVKELSKTERDSQLLTVKCNEVSAKEAKMKGIDLFLAGETGFRIQLNLLNGSRLESEDELAEIAKNGKLSKEKLMRFLRLNADEKDRLSSNDKELEKIWSKIKSSLLDRLKIDFSENRQRMGLDSGEYADNVLLKSSSFFREEDRVDEILERNLGACSSGQRARLKLSWAYLSRSRLIIIDEPLRSLQHSESDDSDYQRMVRILRMMGKRTGMVVITHDSHEDLISQFKASTGNFIEITDDADLELVGEKVSIQEVKELAKKVKFVVSDRGLKDLLETISTIKPIMEKTLNKMGDLVQVSELHWVKGDHSRWLREDSDLRKILEPVILQITEIFDQVFKEGKVESNEKAEELKLLSDFARNLRKWKVSRVESKEMVSDLVSRSTIHDKIIFMGDYKGRESFDSFTSWLHEVEEEWSKKS